MTSKSAYFSKVNSLSKVAKITRISLIELQNIAENSQKHYRKEFREVKGKKREFNVPLSNLMTVQKLLEEYLTPKIPWPAYMHGGIKGRSTQTNSLPHIGQKYLLSLDIENYYPSITDSMVLAALVSYGMERKCAKLVTSLCTCTGSLPLGAPTSTFLGNLIFLPMGQRIDALCKKHKFIFTNFVDDINISGGKDVSSILGTVEGCLRKNGFSLSRKKRKISGQNEPKLVTKVVTNDKLRQNKFFVSQLKKDIRQTWLPGGLALLAKANSKTILQMQKNLWGRISHIRIYNKKLAREVRKLMVKSRF